MCHRNQHFVHGDAAVLEGVAVVTDVIVVVVRIGEEIALAREDKGCAGSFEHIVCHRRTEEGQDVLHLDPRAQDGGWN